MDSDLQRGSSGAATPTAQGATEAAQQAVGTVRERADDALGKARTQVDERSTELGRQMRSLADVARDAGGRLRDQEGQELPSRMVASTADRLEQLGSYLERTDANGFMDDVERLGRRSPAALMAGGIAVGILAARFVKASSANRGSSPTSAAETSRWSPSFASGTPTGSLGAERDLASTQALPGSVTRTGTP
jgi:hypothetical protein